MLVQAKCPNCGANVKVENSGKQFVCEHCGAECLLEDVINNCQTVNNYNTTQNIVKNVYGKDGLDVSDLIRNADVFLSLGEFGKAEKLYMQAINTNPADWHAWFGMVKLKTKNFTILSDKTHLSYLEKAKKVADSQRKTEIDNIYSEYLQKIEEEKERQRKIEEERIREQQKREIEEREESKRRVRRFAKTLAILLPILILLLILVLIVYGIIEKKTYCFGDYGKYVEKYNVSEFVIPEGVTNIDNRAFYRCNTLTQIVIPNSVTSIGKEAFAYCDSLTTVTFGDNSQLTSIGGWVFFSCNSLTEIVIPDSVTSIGEGVFVSCDSLTNIKVDANNAIYKDIDGNLYSKNGKTLLRYATGKTATTFVVPDSVTSIGSYAFDNCDSLTEIVIPNSVTSIGEWAFAFCDSLTEIVIPSSVTSIGASAFFDCDSLTQITFSDISTWYRTTSESNWNNKTGGTQTNVTTPTQNATYFKSSYYWYKL